MRTHVNPRRTDLDGIRAGNANLRIDAKTATKVEQSRQFRLLVREAMQAAGLSQKAFAIEAGQSESVISEALAGTRNLAADWVWAQDDAFWLALSTRIASARNFSPEREDEIEEAQILQVVGVLLKRRRKSA